MSNNEEINIIDELVKMDSIKKEESNMKEENIYGYLSNKMHTPERLLYKDGMKDNIEGKSSRYDGEPQKVKDYGDSYNEIIKVLATDSDVKGYLPYDSPWGTDTFRVQIYVSSKGWIGHRKNMVDGYRKILDLGYEVAPITICKYYKEWYNVFKKDFVYYPETKSEANKAWDNEIGENITYDIRSGWMQHITIKVKNLIREDEPKVEDEREPTLEEKFDNLRKVS